MTEHLKVSVLGILSWLKEHQADGYTTVEAIATPFALNQDQMKRNLQWLQGYECVKRGGPQNAAWSITDQGLARLAEGKFSSSGAFLTHFHRTETFTDGDRDRAR
ncbi:MAG TPA: hypothetical protein VMW65_00320 [Chloroflexota bacterium]|nr:hypothetical protein [Chloroflexota bacterium]